MAITIQISKKFEEIDFSEKSLEKLVKSICKRFSLANAAIDIEVVGDAQIRKLNRKFLKRNRTTDCLSFDLSDNSSYPPMVYQIVVNAEMAKRQAKKRRHPAEAELALYITHCLLHHIGYDDRSKKQAEKMHETEDRILQQLGYGLVYNKKAGK